MFLDQLPIHVLFEVIKSLSADDLLIFCLLSKAFQERTTTWAKNECLRWWRTNLRFRYNETLANDFHLEETIYPLLQQQFGSSYNWRTLWRCLSNPVDVWSLPPSQTIMCYEKSSLFLRIGQLVTRPNCHLRWCETSNWSGALWMWTGPYLKIEHNRTKKGYLASLYLLINRSQYQLFIVKHSTHKYDIKQGLAVINGGIVVKGLFYVGTHHIDDDYVECVFLCKAVEIYNNGKTEGVIQSNLILIN